MKPLIPWFEPPKYNSEWLDALIRQFRPGFDELPVHGFGILVAMGFVLGSLVAQRKAAQLTSGTRAARFPDRLTTASFVVAVATAAELVAYATGALSRAQLGWGFLVSAVLIWFAGGTHGAAADRINRLVTWLIVGTFVGGHVGHVLMYEPESLARDPRVLLRVWEGLSSYGGFLACVPITIWFFAREKQSWWPYADALAIGLTLGWFFGRMGCFSAHDHPGLQTTTAPLGVYGMCPGGNKTIACHDTGLYEGIFSGLLWILFEILDRKPRFHGFYVGWLAMLYGPYRFFSDFYRAANGVDVRYIGLTPAQWGSLLVTVLGIWILRTRSKTPVVASAAA